jgi:SAM-dependent methyltransferase
VCAVTRASPSPFYKDSGRIPFASRLSYAARRRIFDLFMETMRPSPDSLVLDIGVTMDIAFRESNFFEQFYPYKDRIVCVGTEDAVHLERIYPGLRFVPVRPGLRLPFSDRQFDLVFSNAVVEHAGDSRSQQAFVAEACRVGVRVFISTPNRWFPVEHHTGAPLLHYLPARAYRRILGTTPLRYWSQEDHLNLLTVRALTRLFPDAYPLSVQRVGVGVGVFKSNVVAFTAPGC